MLRKLVLSFVLVSCSILLYGQATVVKGRVMDDLKDPLTGVSVTIKGTTKGTSTNIDGNYSLEVNLNETLVFSFLGMNPKEILYTGQDPLNVELSTRSEFLDEVVVIGYQTIKKADLTGAVSVFNPDQMKNKTVTGTVGDALGSLPGIMVRTAGNPGSEGKVVIRGTGTLGTSTPLYVVDGIVSDANRDFNFNDIASIQVLKDASAAAIYGSRAANGVVIITTKQGKEGAMKIEVSSRLTLQTLPKYKLVGREDWIRLNDLAVSNAGQDLKNHFDADTDWQDEVFKTGIINDHNISFSGGNESSRYFISANYQSNSGTTIGTSSERYTLRSNTSASRNWSDALKFTVGENVTLSYYDIEELDTNPIIDVYRMLPTIPVYDENNAALGGFGFGDGSRDVTFGVNPVAKEALTDTRNSNFRTRGNVYTELEVLKMFKYRFNLGANLSSDKHQYLRKKGNWSYNQPAGDPSSLTKNQAFSSQLIFDNTLEFNKTFGKHDISSVIGTSFQKGNYERIWGTKNDILMTGSGSYLTMLDAGLTNPKTGNYKDYDKLFSIFGRVNYNFDNRYLLSFTMRRDESSKFSKDNRVGYFPSVSAGWRISQEEFFKVSWVNDLKIRANYGVLGSSNIGVWDYVNFMNVYPQAIFGNDQSVNNGMTQVKLVNEDLKWEKLSQVNLGLDASLLRNRLDISFDYFSKETKDVLAPMTILLSSGNNGGDPWVNAATLRNTGFEMTATWRDQIGGVGYNATVNASYLKNKIVDLGYGGEPHTEWATRSEKGRSIGEWYLIKTDGIFRTAEEAAAHVNSEGKPIKVDGETIPQAGDVRYIDLNDDGYITDADRQYCGSSIPKYQLGINLGIDYKGFDLSAQFTGAFGHKLFNGPRSAYDKFDDNSAYRKSYDPWTIDNPNAKDPRPIYDDARNVRGNQDRWLEKGDYLRLSQLALGYNLPKSVMGNVLSGVRVYVNMQNLLTITSYKGLDPEFLNGNVWMRGYDGGAFPNPKGFTFGTQISF